MAKGSGGKASVAREMRRVRNQFGAEAEAEKRRLLTLMSADPPRTAHALRHAHEDLLFLRAFPGEAATLRLVKKVLRLAPAWVAALSRAERQRLHDTGIAGTVTRHVFPFPMARWLTRRATGAAEIDWRRYDNPAQMDRALSAVLRPAELEAAESGEISTREVFRTARCASSASDLDWIVGALTSLKEKNADALWAEAEAPLAWSLASSRWSTTRNVLPSAPVVFRKSMRRPPGDVAQRILEPMRPEILPRARARQLIELAQTALGARCREVLPTSYPNPDEVHWCDLGEGASLAIFGVAPSHRLNLETNTGYLLVSNGVPVGYGGVTPFYRQANTGINIFDPFRGSEAAYLWVEMLRAFHSVYGVTRFVVNGYQFGEGNSEAINSGAYWFYYRLGFRPDHEAQRKLAAREGKRLSRPGAGPSERAVLRTLAKGDLILELPGFDARDALEESLLVKASRAASRTLAKAPHLARVVAEAQIAQEAAAALSASDLKSWTRDERAAFNRLAPIVMSVKDVQNWPEAEKRKIIAMMRAKGSRQERDFAQAAGRCEMFFRALAMTLRNGDV
ncbi:MAG: hypothetical protein AB7F91_02660 [Parvularculaceae bacterium]